MHSVVEESYEEQAELYIDGLTTENAGKDIEQAYAEIEVATHKIKFKIDTGAQTNAIPEHVFQKLFKGITLQPATQRLTAYGGEQLKVRGTCKLRCRYRDRTVTLEFHIVDTKAPPILGMRASLDLNLLKLILAVSAEDGTQGLLEEYADVFQGIGEFPGECHLRIDPNATPVAYPPRRVPIALRDRLKQELNKMEKSNIICKVTEPTEWVNALVVVEKPHSGKLRVCLDPRDLNKALQRPHYPLPTLEDATAKLAGARYFSVLDARSGYWAIKLSAESSLLTTFNMPFGRYRFLRLPFGLNSAQDEFQRRVDETYEGLSGVTAIVDDILVAGKTKREHDDNLRAMLQRTRERGVRLNPDKCQICVPEVSYFGHTLSSEGIKPDPMKVKAIQEMQPPKNRAELETILGMVKYLARFTPHLSQIKDLITHHPVLAYFDPLKELRLQVDASKCGLGAVMLQGERPVAYASKSLNSTEENYAQIEKELYAVLFGCKRFHEYMYGRRVIVESDHKPLEAILRKPLAAAPPRLQRMILQLQRYDIHIIHRPGKEIPVADTLSRKSIEHHDSGITEGLEAQVHTLISNVPVSKNKLQEIREATAQDTQLTTLRNITKSGWPDERKKCPLNIQEFWNHRDEIVEIDGILFKGEKIIIPHTLRADMIHRIHTGHMGIEKSKSRARDILFWPGMGKQIEASVAQCDICQERRSSNTKEPLLSHAIPERPWQVVGTDLLEWNSQDFVIIADYYSRYFEIEKLTNCTSSAVITKLKAAFARHGIPETVISDNGPCYSSTEFCSFSGAWDFRHITTSPRYPRSNGLAERTVQTAKHILDKAKAENKDHYLGLLEHRNTPVDNLNSPAQLLMSRRLRSILPTTAKQLQPQVARQEAVRERREVCQHRQQVYYNKSARPLSHLPVGTPVRFQQEDGSWKPAIVTQLADTQRSYHIQTKEGKTLRRNRLHLHESKEGPNTMDTQHTHTENAQHTHANNMQPQHPEVTDHPQPGSQPPGYTTSSFHHSTCSTNMFTPASLLLLLAAASYVFCATDLIQPDSVLIKPGEPLTITCTVSGASITDSSSHFGTAWIRHPAGKALEWINHIYYDGDIRAKDSLKSKFTVSRDTSRNTITLQGQNLQAEDTAVYYCARHVHGISLSSSPAQLKAPGESVKLSCEVSGYLLTDYGTGWIRQPPGKALEWIGIIWGGGGIDSGTAFKSRFKISRDTSSNVLFLEISSLQAGDTAVNSVSLQSCGEQRGSHRFNFYTNHVLYISTAPAGSCFLCYELTQPGSMVVPPGQTLTIDCKVSYSVTSEWTGWICQPAGKALEYIGRIDSGGSTAYSDKLKNKFSISRNTGTNTVTLQGQNLQTEDTAVYYCAGDPQ
ncbi:hypothetical protein NFI96_009493 [Prochilodus magdalenae]|nr:hypothetical protein NFI96_009493 [Prochilodus magdalenae]